MCSLCVSPFVIGYSICRHSFLLRVRLELVALMTLSWSKLFCVSNFGWLFWRRLSHYRWQLRVLRLPYTSVKHHGRVFQWQLNQWMPLVWELRNLLNIGIWTFMPNSHKKSANTRICSEIFFWKLLLHKKSVWLTLRGRSGAVRVALFWDETDM